LSNY